VSRYARFDASAATVAESVNMSDQDRIRNFLTDLYHSIWSGWYADQPAAKPALVTIEFSDGVDFYDPPSHQLKLRVSGWNEDDIVEVLDNFDSKMALDEWPAWYISLIHEMVHEYQHRVLKDMPTPEGAALEKSTGRKWDGNGHGPGFFAAIANRAQFLQVSAERFCMRL